ncbi:nuclear transport factor 2 family protein [Actinokineospora terrae]|uniref:Ketosteroid isomerase-related protein n=1 Tax=Actinokineospora terrae TaxID=155974 RepID=A0A1H9MJZ2_9PSEU|nr:nuclear transport factor 2 family protein [Actinokineospora terrae]SER23777.1 Ketosteroid isomerase-related protein [Actinokineospora terrae]
MSTTHPRLDGPPRLWLLDGLIEAVRAVSDRADPLDETVLCLAESAAIAAASVESARSEPPGSSARRAAMARSLAAARAAVVCATYALADEPRVEWSKTMTTTDQAVDGAALARAVYDRVDADDVEGLLALFTEDCVYTRPGYQPWVGHAGLATFYREVRSIRSGAHTLTAVLATGRDVAVHGEFHGLLRTGDEVHLRFAEFLELAADGRVARRITYYFAPLA